MNSATDSDVWKENISVSTLDAEIQVLSWKQYSSPHEYNNLQRHFVSLCLFENNELSQQLSWNPVPEKSNITLGTSQKLETYAKI